MQKSTASKVVTSHCWTITGADKRQIGLFISAQFNRYRIEEENYDEKVRADKKVFYNGRGNAI